MRVLGLMSGTSSDGIDAVLAEFLGKPDRPNWSLLKSFSLPYPSALRDRVLDAGQGVKLSSDEWIVLAEDITEMYYQAALACDSEGQAQLVGCHGQTVYHRPPSTNKRGATCQLLQAPLLAQLLELPVVHDFRAVDLAVGGEGAPLVPPLDAAILGRVQGWRAVLNLGGIANLTLIPPSNGPNRFDSVLGWDCGPANTLVDFAVQKITNGELNFDRNGLIAASGSPHEPTIDSWLKESFFHKPPPKSTGREQFGRADLENRLCKISPLRDEDLIATLTAFTGAVIAQDLNNLQSTYFIRPIELLVAGGGCLNPVMLREIRKRCRGMIVSSIEDHGIPPQSREALAFALLTWWHTLNYQSNTPPITGALRPVVLGTRVNPG